MNNDMLPVGTTVHINPEDMKWEMKGDLISREALKKSIKSYADDQYAENEYLGEYTIMEIINNAPTVTVDNYSMGYQDGIRKASSERPQGKWIFRSDSYYKCSNCGEVERAEKNYCSNCGAKMQKGNTNG